MFPLSAAQSLLCDLLKGIDPTLHEHQKLSTPAKRELVKLLVDHWQLLPSIDITNLDRLLNDPAILDDCQRLRHCWLGLTAFMKAQGVAFRAYIRTAEELGLIYSLLKGSAASYTLYSAPHQRAAWDLDIGVRRMDLEKARELALSLGFVSAQLNPSTNLFVPADPLLQKKVEANHYELAFLVRRQRVMNLTPETRSAIRNESWNHRYWHWDSDDVPWCYAVIDIHHGISLDIGLDGLLSGAREISAQDLVVRVPSLAWLAAHLIFKVYWEGVHNYGKGLYQYADLARLFCRIDEGEFGILIEILKQYRLEAAGFYVLRVLDPYFGVKLPPYVCNFLKQTALPARGTQPIPENDLGDMWPKLWGCR